MFERTAYHNSSGSSSLNTILFILITCMISAFVFTSTATAYLSNPSYAHSSDTTVVRAAEAAEQAEGLNIVNIVLLTMVSATLPLIICIRLPSHLVKNRPYSVESDQGYSGDMHRNIRLS